MDRAFFNEINALSEATAAEYSRMCYRDGIHRAWFDMIIVRDFYRCVLVNGARSLVVDILSCWQFGWMHYILDFVYTDSLDEHAL